MKIYENIEELIGKTPLLRLNNIKKELGLKGNVLVKLESFNPAGSVKDRAALFMINDAEKRGVLKEGGTIIEPTSGNTGIGISMISARRGYNAVLVMPDSMSLERIKLLKAYGAKVVLTEGKLGMKGAIEKAEEIQKTTPNSFIVGQFENPSNIDAHFFTTAREILDDTEGGFSAFVAGIGSGGTISGTGKFFKENNLKVKIIGVEPYDSPLISLGKTGPHKIQGIGANFVPKNYKDEFVDEVMTAEYNESKKAVKLLAEKEGVLVGISSGASLSVAIRLASLDEYKDKNIVVLLPDTGDRYLSTDLFD